MDDDRALGALLRAWRDRLDPLEVGVPVTSTRRSRGLRREELADRAGLSVDYLIRLEQGRATNPSEQVIVSLARALLLNADERGALFQLTGRRPPVAVPGDGMPAGVRRLLERLSDVPVAVHDDATNLLAWNEMWARLHGEPDEDPLQRNVAWRAFLGGGSRIVRDAEESARAQTELVASLRAASVRRPQDPAVAFIVRELRRTSDRFDRLWNSGVVAARVSDRKTFDHPEIGRVTVDCDVLHVQGSDLHIVAYTVEPGSPAAAQFERLRSDPSGLRQAAGPAAGIRRATPD
ncbi:MAG TPA: helix-turn-helix domain-containing protein [Humibacter sp.]|nr:helix-turn-helix domain-containing protein [Humibacter sp.]